MEWASAFHTVLPVSRPAGRATRSTCAAGVSPPIRLPTRWVVRVGRVPAVILKVLQACSCGILECEGKRWLPCIAAGG